MTESAVIDRRRKLEEVDMDDEVSEPVPTVADDDRWRGLFGGRQVAWLLAGCRARG
jgi:hypothetical protein